MGSGADRYFEDYVVGEVQELGTACLSEAEIIDFARKYDPQDFHIDPEKAVAGPFGGLIASGWHTAAVVMQPYVESYLSNVSSLGSPGLDQLRWLAPVRPGDELTVLARVPRHGVRAASPTAVLCTPKSRFSTRMTSW